MRVKAKVPGAAFLVGQYGVHCRIVKEQHALGWLAFIVLVDGVNKRSGYGRRVALHDDLRAVVDGRFHGGQGFFNQAFAVVTL